MSEPVISVKNISKCYRLGTIGRHTLVDEVAYWWHKVRGKDPSEHFSKVGHSATENRRVQAESRGNSKFWALKNVSFDVQAGEVIGVIGRNGAGKSTLLKILTRITEPSSGEAVLDGRVASLLEVGTGFHPELTGRENVYMNGTILGMKRREIDEKFDAIVAFSELEKFIDTPVKRYSSGMYVRLAFAVAAHLDPEILLVDEVLAVGDAEFQKKCLGKMSEVAGQGRTVLFVSHNMAAVRQLCKKTILIDHGELRYYGKTKEAVDLYLDSGSVEMTGAAVFDKSDFEAAITSIQLTKNTGETSVSFSCDEQAQVEIFVEAKRSVHSVEIYFRLFDTNNSLLLHCSSNTSSSDGSLQNLEVGKYRFTTVLPSHYLAPGRYHLSCGIQQRNVRELDRNTHVLSFDVLNVGIHPGLLVHAENGNVGKVLLLPDWDVTRLP